MTDFDWGHKLTREHFRYFVGACQAWEKFLGLLDWDITHIFLEADEDDPRAMMSAHDLCNRTAGITLYDHWDRVPTDYYLWMTAFHECLELMMADVHYMAMSRNFDYSAYDREHHRVIRMFENSIFKEIWDAKLGIFNFQSSAEEGEVSRPKLPELDHLKPMYDPGVSDDEQPEN